MLPQRDGSGRAAHGGMSDPRRTHKTIAIGDATYEADCRSGLWVRPAGKCRTVRLIAIVHGFYQRDLALIVGMIASLITCGAVTVLTIMYRTGRKKTGTVASSS